MGSDGRNPLPLVPPTVMTQTGRLAEAHAPVRPAHAFEAEVDGAGMLALEPREPVLQRGFTTRCTASPNNAVVPAS